MISPCQTPEEKYLFSIGTFDLCIFDDPTKKAKYIDLMKGAWEQKTYRKKAKTKKKIGVNLYINEEIKQKLNEIAKKRNIKTTALIEEMIENEHKKTFKTEKSMNNEWSFLI
jgi:allophanate hydrolase subunit 1